MKCLKLSNSVFNDEKNRTVQVYKNFTLSVIGPFGLKLKQDRYRQHLDDDLHISSPLSLTPNPDDVGLDQGNYPLPLSAISGDYNYVNDLMWY